MSHALSSQEVGSDSAGFQTDISYRCSTLFFSLLSLIAALIWSLPATHQAFGLGFPSEKIAHSALFEAAVAQELSASLSEDSAPRYPSYKMLQKPVSNSMGLPVIQVGHRHLDAVQDYISGKYRVSVDQARKLVSTAHTVGREMELDPLLLLAIMAIESSFDPQAQSRVGAQGLMQVMTRVHHERFKPFGGPQAAFHPVANIRVGASILKEYVTRSGSLQKGLKMYVGVGPNGKSFYGDKVLAERKRMATAAGLPAELPNRPVLNAESKQTQQDEVAWVLNQTRPARQAAM